MNIIGISAFYHESACCLLKDGKLAAAASEERFSRVKHDPRLPVESFRFCLSKGQLDILDIDCIAYYESPVEKLSRQLWSGIPENSPGDLPWLDPGQPERAIREKLGWDGPILTFKHHQSHAAGSFFYSGFPEAAIFTADGVGEWATTTYGKGDASGIHLFEEVHFPHSLGLFYSAITSYLGFKVNNGEYKVMGLAPFGEPKYRDQMRQLIQSEPGGGFSLDMDYFDYIQGSRMFSPELCDLFKMPAREPGSEITPFHADIAMSLQSVFEEILVEKINYLGKQVDSPNLCMAGGCALNCVANSRILRDGPFERLFVQPAAGDAGACLGAAALAYLQRTGKGRGIEPMTDACLGPVYSHQEISSLPAATGLQARDYSLDRSALLNEVCKMLEEGKIIGWFNGAMEFGPRALGARSILADPRDESVKDRLNQLIKRRENFRPFAPVVLLEHAPEHFALDHPSPFMLETCPVISPLQLPAVTHVDGSARPQTITPGQNPRLSALLETFFKRTGCPVLLNTSFNVRGEPIVRSPEDALLCMEHSGLDCLVLEDFLVHRHMLPGNWTRLLPDRYGTPTRPPGGAAGVLNENLYTFV
ncbi:MAG: carbamoyltransferase [bacterium]|nr:carbamoyltransferase [bacterium]